MRIVLIFLFTFRARSQIIDCHPEPKPTQKLCLKRGCIWSSKFREQKGPLCFYDTDIFAGYDVKLLKGQEILLERRNTPEIVPHETLQLYAYWENKIDYFRLRIQSKHRPIQRKFNRDEKDSEETAFRPEFFKTPFGFRLFRGGNKIAETIGIPGLIMSPQYVQFSFRLSSDRVYGFGEQLHTGLKRNFQWEVLNLFANDHQPTIEFENQNLYGFQPIALALDSENMAYGIFLNNTHGMSIQFQPSPPTVTFRIMGGEIDLYFLPGPTPDFVIRQLTALIGKPQLPPYWSLGFQLSRYGYHNVTEVEKVWERNRAAGIPQDVQFIDVDYMDGGKDFTYNSHFHSLPRLVQKLHNAHVKLVLIFDPPIAAKAHDYQPLNDGLRTDVFIKDNRSGKPLEGVSWPGNVYWPDFTNPKAVPYWSKQIVRFHKKIAFDGMWIDMNEPGNSRDGSTSGCANNSLNFPPFSPVRYQPIYKRTLCLDGVQSKGYHYEWHNLYGHYEARATFLALRDLFPQKRPFLLSRSTAPGSGVYAAHWTGDNLSTWEQMNHTLITNLEFGMFGIPVVGTDICGFSGNTTQELCIRWSQLGAFYVFSRNHNHIRSRVDQDPAAWPKNTTEAIRSVLRMRYALLPHLYTLLFKAHVNGSSVLRPLFFEFPHDPALHNLHDQFLWGPSLMIVPILSPFSEERNAYFPSEEGWFDTRNNYARTEAGWRNLKIPKNAIGLFIRPGHTIPWQSPAQTTFQTRKNPMGITIALRHGASEGELIWDDGESFDSFSAGNYCHITFQTVKYCLHINPLQSGCPTIPTLKYLHFAGLHKAPTKLIVDGHVSKFTFNSTTNALFAKVSLPLKLKHHIQIFVQEKKR